MALQALLQDPARAIQDLYLEAGSPGTSGDFDLSERLKDAFAATELATKIPLLASDYAHTPMPNRLVRLQGMIQDMTDPEYYHGAVQLPDGSWHTSKYQDQVPQSAELETTKIWERRPMLCVPVPGRSAWTLPDSSAGGSTSSQASVASPEGAGQGRTDNKECIVYVYDQSDSALCLLDVIDVIGLVTYDSVPCGHGDCEECEGQGAQSCSHHGDVEAAGDQGTTEAGRKVMRVHALVVRRNPPLMTCSTPAVTAAAPQVVQEQQGQEGGAGASEARAKVVQLLSRCLGGDDLAAEYLLMSCLSRVVARPKEGSESVVGTLPINITACPPSAPAPKPAGKAPATQPPRTSSLTQALQLCLSSLFPLMSKVPLTVEACNSAPGWRPHRDEMTMRVTKSPLQLPPGCVLLVDELVLSEGKLNDTGIKSLQALNGVLTEQVLRYDFEYCTNHPFPVDVPVVVLSEGRSLLHDAISVTVPLAPSASLMGPEEVSAMLASVDAATLTTLRQHLAQATQAPYSISDEMAEELQREFVAARKGGVTALTAEEFQQLLTVARLHTLSSGASTLTPERWKAVRMLETQRHHRVLANRPATKPT